MGRSKNLTLTDATQALLEAVGNQSGYVERLIEQRTREWHEALALLSAAGWKPNEVRAACDALNGAWEILGSRPPQWLAAELEDTPGLCEKWDIPPAQWKGRIREVASSYEIAWAVRTSARECWSSNDAWDAAVERIARRRT